MKAKIWLHLMLIVALILLLASSIIGCSTESPERSAIESYLNNTGVIINEATELALKISSLYETANKLDASEVVTKCATYGKAYDDLFARFMELQYPSECSKLREYLIDGITYSKQEVTEFGAAFATGDMEHLYKAESYYNDAQRAIALAVGEMHRLEKE